MDGAPGALAMASGLGRFGGTGGFAGVPAGAEHWEPRGLVPPGQTDGAAVFDPTDNQTVFESTGSPGGVNTWISRNGSWSEVVGAPDPSPSAASLLFDPADGYVLHLGFADLANDSWAFAGNNWAKLPMSAGPAARSGAAVTYDPGRTSVLLFGGSNATRTFGDTWEYRGGNWTRLVTSAAPPARDGALLGYDPALGQAILFGGSGTYQGLPTVFNDTWAFGAGGWTQIPTPAAPHFGVGEHPYGLVFDPIRDRLNLFAGGGSTWGNWIFDGHTWSAGPSGMNFSGYPGAPPFSIPGDGLTLLASPAWGAGTSLGFYRDRNDSWVADPPSASSGSCGGNMVNYPPLGGVLCVGGGSSALFANDTWSVAPVQSFPSPRSYASATYIPRNRSVLLFGGENFSTYQTLGDTWELRVDGWHRILVPPSEALPPPGISLPLAYDPLDKYSVLLDPAGPLNRSGTWIYQTGNWTWLPVHGPTFFPGAHMAWDASSQQLILFAREQGCGRCNDTWAFSRGTWTNVTSPGPGALSGFLIVSDPAGGVDLFGGSYDIVSGGRYEGSVETNDLWHWNSSGWTNISEAPWRSPVARIDAAGAFDTTNSEIVMSGGVRIIDQFVSPEPLFDSWVFRNQSVRSTLPILDFRGDPASLPLGNNTTLLVTTAGGGPANYSYSNLSGGCPSLNTSALTCSWGQPGVYLPSVRVREPGGRTAWARTVVTMFPGLSVLLTSNTTVTHPRSAVTFAAQIVGGVPPVRATVSGAYAGPSPLVECGPVNAPRFSCTFFVAGLFVVNITVRDSAGAVGIASAGVCVFTGSGICVSPKIDSFIVSPLTLHLGGTLAFEVVATGSPPLGYVYTGLPTGCVSRNTSDLACTPLQAGTFAVRVVVADPLNVSVGATATVVVLSPVGGSTLRTTASPLVNSIAWALGAAAVAVLAGGIFYWRWTSSTRRTGSPPRPPP